MKLRHLRSSSRARFFGRSPAPGPISGPCAPWVFGLQTRRSMNDPKLPGRSRASWRLLLDLELERTSWAAEECAGGTLLPSGLPARAPRCAGRDGAQSARQCRRAGDQRRSAARIPMQSRPHGRTVAPGASLEVRRGVARSALEADARLSPTRPREGRRRAATSQCRLHRRAGCPAPSMPTSCWPSRPGVSAQGGSTVCTLPGARGPMPGSAERTMPARWG